MGPGAAFTAFDLTEAFLPDRGNTAGRPALVCLAPGKVYLTHEHAFDFRGCLFPTRGMREAALFRPSVLIRDFDSLHDVQPSDEG